MSSMRVERKTDTKNGIARLVFVVIASIIQIAFLYFAIFWVNGFSAFLRIMVQVIAVILILVIYGKHKTSSMKMSWLIIISVLPLLGIILYFLMDSEAATGPMRKRFESIDARLSILEEQDDTVQDDLHEIWPESTGVSHYLWKVGHFPLCKAEETTFYGDTRDALRAQLEDLEQAKHFIFMEYYAIEDKESFALVHEVLKAKVKEGVEVRLFYDDVGSITFITSDFAKRMQDDGIETRIFNKVMPSLRIFMNNRDHRKITVIDGRVAYTGGYNLANEYFNITHPYGEWSDAGIRLTGPAVHTYTTMFLEMWNAIRASDHGDHDFGRYYPGLKISDESLKKYLKTQNLDDKEASFQNWKDREAKYEEEITEEKKHKEKTNKEEIQDPLAASWKPMWDNLFGQKNVASKNSCEESYSPSNQDKGKIKAQETSSLQSQSSQMEFVQPYCDSPLDDKQVGEDVYMTIVNSAKEYVYFVTPYLILTDEMSRALSLAANRGVDVRIVTPGIPDKKMTYQLTRSYYAQLVRNGVRIYEFKPGFCHDKICVSDDRICTCGTINLDYRSLYHHFEDGCVMYSNRLALDVKAKILTLMARGEEVTSQYQTENRKLGKRIFQCILRLFAPLM